ncbi:MAG: hypothetical protein IT438_03285 [Phycisphaerales bacterium]|nr:hypothetical protein [Phycisphaerales bacterium]
MTVYAKSGIAATLLSFACSTLAQLPTIVVNPTPGTNVPSSGSTPDIVVTGTQVIQAAPGYSFRCNPMVHGTGFLGLLAIGGSSQPLESVINSFFTGGQRTLYGWMRNPSGTVPTLLDTEPVGGTFSGIPLSLTFHQELLADGRGRLSITDIMRPSSLGIVIDSGGATFSTWTPPAAVKSEWQFEGDLLSVKQSGVAWGASSGPARMRYLDDSAFGPLLGGVGAETTSTPSTPQNVTLAQSSFGTTANFGIPPVGGTVDTVYRTSPPRNATDPANTAKSRGLGLAMWPNTRDFWPDDRNGQWTMVWDLLIPAASWNAANTAGGNKQVVALIEDSQNNNSAADAFIRVTGPAGSGGATVGYSIDQVGGAVVAAPAIQPDQWFRLALVVDHYGTKTGKVFVNGVPLGATGSDWLYNAVKSTDPRWGDLTSGSFEGSPIAPATWTGWGQFPSPWAAQPTAPNAPTASTCGLFADITGKGESVYIANLLFSDEAMTDAQAASLGGPNARGIFYTRPAPCIGDFNHSGGQPTVQDIFDFLAAYFTGDPSADVNNSGGAPTVQDIFDFLAAYFAGCN